MNLDWIGKLMASLKIDGQVFTGERVDIVGRNIYINGVKQDHTVAAGQQKLQIEVLSGVLGELHADGSVSCGQVNGSVDAGGSINVNGAVGGNVKAGGSANIVGNVAGNCKAGGSLNVRG